jgi:hypothetical protein
MEEEDCPKTRIFSGFFGFPRFRVARIRKRWNPCIAPSLVLTTLSCVRSTAVFPGFFQNYSRIIGSSRCDEQDACRCEGHDGAPRLAPAIGRATPLRKMFQRDAILARRQMMVPVSQVALKPLLRCAVVETARARWHVALDEQCARPGTGTLINLCRWVRARRAATIDGSRRSPPRCACSCIAIDRRA